MLFLSMHVQDPGDFQESSRVNLMPKGLYKIRNFFNIVLTTPPPPAPPLRNVKKLHYWFGQASHIVALLLCMTTDLKVRDGKSFKLRVINGKFFALGVNRGKNWNAGIKQGTGSEMRLEGWQDWNTIRGKRTNHWILANRGSKNLFVCRRGSIIDSLVAVVTSSEKIVAPLIGSCPTPPSG